MKTTQTAESSAPLSLAAPTDLEPAGRDRVVELLAVVLPVTFALQLKAKNFHWRVVGSHYREYHRPLDEQAAIRDDDVVAHSARAMIDVLCRDNRLLISELRRVHNACDEACDVARASLLENFIDESERRTRFPYATSSAGDHSQ